MIIEINDDLFYKLVELMKNRNTTIYNELKDIKPLDTVATDTLAKARELKTQKVKQLISRTIKELLSSRAFASVSVATVSSGFISFNSL
jgi:hypothetical protein